MNMKKVILISFLVLSVKFYAQEVPKIPCPNNIEQEVLKGIKEYLLKNNYDFNNFKIVQSLYIQVDSCESIRYEIDTKILYLIEEKRNENNKWITVNLFKWDIKQKKMSLIEKDNYSKNLLLSVPSAFNSSCNYFINLWRNSKFECLYARADDELEKIGGIEYLSTNILNYFSNLTEYLEYSFGSVENYIETYCKRKDFLQKQRQKGIKLLVTQTGF